MEILIIRFERDYFEYSELRLPEQLKEIVYLIPSSFEGDFREESTIELEAFPNTNITVWKSGIRLRPLRVILNGNTENLNLTSKHILVELEFTFSKAPRKIFADSSFFWKNGLPSESDLVFFHLLSWEEDFMKPSNWEHYVPSYNTLKTLECLEISVDHLLSDIEMEQAQSYLKYFLTHALRLRKLIFDFSKVKPQDQDSLVKQLHGFQRFVYRGVEVTEFR